MYCTLLAGKRKELERKIEIIVGPLRSPVTVGGLLVHAPIHCLAPIHHMTHVALVAVPRQVNRPAFPFVQSPPKTQYRIIRSSANKTFFALAFISHGTHPMASSSSPSSPNFQLIINNALDTYKKRTKNDLLAHPLAAKLQSCNTPSAILAILDQQIQGLDHSRSSDDRWTRWLDPTVNVLLALSETLGEGVSLV